MRKRRPDPVPILDALPDEFRRGPTPSWGRSNLSESERQRIDDAYRVWDEARMRWVRDHGYTMLELFRAECDLLLGRLPR